MEQSDKIKSLTSNLKKIGQGQFTECYTHPTNNKKVLLVSSDNTKEAMAYGITQPNRRFPKVEFYNPNNSEYKNVFIMEKLQTKPKYSDLLPKEVEIYKELRNLFRYKHSRLRGADSIISVFKESGVLKKHPYFRKQLIDYIQDLRNYGGEICFEVFPRNMAVKNKRLILLDCFFFI